jgi:hypothetical protein
LGFGVWGLGFGVWGLGFRVWGLGFGVWGLGFGVLGLGVQGYLTHKKSTPPLGTPYGPRHMLLQGPRGGLLFMSEVPL